jgi:FkbM family methyltransferase
MENQRKKKYLRVAALAVLLVVLAAIGFGTQWRFQIVARKMIGELPSLSWAQAFSLFMPYRDPRFASSAGFVKLGRSDGEGHCSHLWQTAVGDIWGDRAAETDLEIVIKEQLVDQVYHNHIVGIEPGDVVIDGGAHLGSFALFALMKGAAHVVLFEPEPGHAACLDLTFADEIRKGRITVVEAAVWHQEAVLHFGGERLSGRVGESGAMEVRAVAIDDMVDELQLDRVDFIKMDIEGAEVSGLRGARQTIAHFGPRMAITVYHRPEHSQQVPEIALGAWPQYQVTVTDKYAYFK